MNASVQVVSVDDQRDQITVHLPDQQHLDRLSMLDRLALRVGLRLVLLSERRRHAAARDAEHALDRERMRREAERAAHDRDRLLAASGLHRTWM
ncbi:hypothetical protein [Gulosibacter faecalis]|uniref:Uncharacterized protein n=1 Tax=Gulosibacter faecalis TaxID=272240 RepID=A0ABW5UVW2_9MICO|nr:hypothetical protein [Gulosibacter faecalis]